MEKVHTFHKLKNDYHRKCRPIQYVINEKGCWICVSHKPIPGGYILLGRPPRQKYLHRLSYELYKGAIPEGLVIRHSCDNPGCINPDHLSDGTQADNVRDRDERNRTAKGEAQGRSKLKEEEVRKILTDTRPQEEIAKEYGVTRANISNIKHRRRWKHIITGAR